ncbi:MAG: RsmB/NOP family class I SAM-dependent RNA methyltransferase [Promethearchaeota archaeon]
MPQQSLASSLARKFGYAPYMIRRYLKLLGEGETRQLLEANDRPLRPAIRVNTLKVHPSELRARMEARGYGFEPVPGVPYGFVVTRAPHPVGATHEYLHGHYMPQGVASMVPAQVLAPSRGDTVVDMCASPGAKSTQLAQLMDDKGVLVLLERNAGRLRRLRANLSRTGVTNFLLFNADAVGLPELPFTPDKVLLDAPCTGEGLVRSDPDRKTSRTVEDLKKLSAVQKRLLAAGLKALLVRGGTLVYSTCSVAPEENEMVIDEVVHSRQFAGRVSIEPAEFPFGSPGIHDPFGLELDPALENCLRFFPHRQDTEGFFVAKLRVSGN